MDGLPGFLQPYQIPRSGAFPRQCCRTVRARCECCPSQRAAFHSAIVWDILPLVALGHGASWMAHPGMRRRLMLARRRVAQRDSLC